MNRFCLRFKIISMKKNICFERLLLYSLLYPISAKFEHKTDWLQNGDRISKYVHRLLRLFTKWGIKIIVYINIVYKKKLLA